MQGVGTGAKRYGGHRVKECGLNLLVMREPLRSFKRRKDAVAVLFWKEFLFQKHHMVATWMVLDGDGEGWW